MQEKWMRGVAITTTVLAVMTSIVSARSSNCTADTQLLTTEEAMKWQYYQSKSIRVQLIDVQRGILQTQSMVNLTPGQQDSITGQMKAYNEERFKNEQQGEKLEAQAKALGKQKKLVGRQGFNYMIAVVFFQIAIMLSSVSALLHRKSMWIIGLLFGVVAIVYFANGFFLFF